MAVGSKLAGIVAGIAARKATNKLLAKAWRRTRHTEPPAHPASPGLSWGDALSWAVASGVAMGIARIVTSRGMATATAKLTGHPPEGMEGPGPERRRS
jgi:hypothetical protein